MRIAICRCKHCQIKYSWQASGNWNLNTPEDYNDSEYCPDCKKTIVDALSKIPKKRDKVSVETDEVDLATLERWEIEERNNHKGFPPVKRVFATLYNWDRQEHKIIRQVDGRDEHEGKVYIYNYCPSEKENCRILVDKEKNLETGEIIGYWK